MVRARTEPRERLSVETERGETVAKALFRLRRAARIALRSFSSAARLSSLNVARNSSMVLGFAAMVYAPIGRRLYLRMCLL